MIGRTAQLTFHPVKGDAEKAAPQAEDGSRALADPDRPDAFLELGPPALTGEGISDARPDFDATSGEGWAGTLSFEKKAAGAWTRLTGEAACAAPGDPGRRVAIVLDDQVVSAPGMRETVPWAPGSPAAPPRSPAASTPRAPANWPRWSRAAPCRCRWTSSSSRPSAPRSAPTPSARAPGRP
ncbi:SecDF P1 head subdomain-containing protein [Streptomyces albidoflavus]